MLYLEQTGNVTKAGSKPLVSLSTDGTSREEWAAGGRISIEEVRRCVLYHPSSQG